MPQSAQRTFAQKDLPPSVETAYYRKCIELRRRINDIEENNDGTRLRMKRLNRAIIKMRLERAFLLEQLEKHMEYNVDDSDRSSSPPPTPTDKPLRSKRSHRKATPTGDGNRGIAGTQHLSPGSVQPIMHQMNPMSSAQSTPDPSRTQQFFSHVPPPVSSPHAAVNGTAQSGLPPIQSALPPLQPQRESGTRFDPAYDEQRPAEHEEDAAGRRRAHSGAQPPEEANGEPKDVEMGDGGFTAVNR